MAAVTKQRSVRAWPCLRGSACVCLLMSGSFGLNPHAVRSCQRRLCWAVESRCKTTVNVLPEMIFRSWLLVAVVPAASAAVSVPPVALSRPVHCEPLTAAPRGEYITTTLAIGRANCPQYGQAFLFVDDGYTITVCSNRIGQFSSASSSPPSRRRTAFGRSRKR